MSGIYVRSAPGRPDRPTILCEAGIVGTSATWSLVQRQLSERFECASHSYDRPGLGASRARRPAVSLDQMVADLESVVGTIGVTQPFVLVAHSFGALIALAFARRHPRRVVGLVLVDPIVAAEWSNPGWPGRWRLWRAWLLTWVAGGLARVGLVRLGLWGLFRRGGGNAGPLLGLSSTMRRLAQEVAKLPTEDLQALRRLWTDPRFFRALRAYLRALPSAARDAPRSADGVPVVVLSGSHLSEAELVHHRQLATRHEVMANTGHWIPFDRPAAVAEAAIRVSSGQA